MSNSPILAEMNDIDQDASRYDYDLPRELIAQQPSVQRDDARLMVVNRASGSIEHFHVRDLPELLAPKDCLVFNDTRVIPARLLGSRTATDGRWEGLFLEAENNIWRILCKTRGKLQTGESVTVEAAEGGDSIQLQLIARLENGQWLARPLVEGELHEILARVGRVPLPHYIRGGDMLQQDCVRYQTVFAKTDGSVAAPTAGLHFTDRLLQRLDERGVDSAYVTLHVGLDTFRPITAERLEEHPMHSEWGCLDESAAARINHSCSVGGRIVAVGTTSVRVLETVAAARRRRDRADSEHLEDAKPVQSWSGKTDLYIRPPYTFRAVDALMTNFHLPRTTLLVLVCCFGGRDLILRAYDTAIEQSYRFYSYGDAMLIL